MSVLSKRGIKLDDDVPQLPKELLHVWHWFIELSHVCDRITPSELLAWQELKGWKLYGYEVDAIMKLERARRS